MVKIKIPLPPDAPFGSEAEWVWADEKGAGLYRIRNVPFFAKGLSFGDLIHAVMRDDALVFEDVARHSGHSTYRLIANKDRHHPEVVALLERLQEMQCTYEAGTGKLVAIDVQPEADIYCVYAMLQQAEEKGTIVFDEGHCGHALRA